MFTINKNLNKGDNMVFHSIYKTRYSNWGELEKEIEKLETTKEEGDAFEQFTFAYFTYYKELYQIKNIYMEKDIPSVLKKLCRWPYNSRG